MNNFNIYFWNVNGRWSSIDSSFMTDYDVVFIAETHTEGCLLRNVNDFHIVADPSYTSGKHGGLAAYVHQRLFPYISKIRFTKCTLSFTFTVFPQFCFMLIYIYPIDSINYDITDFSIISEEISFWLSGGIIR